MSELVRTRVSERCLSDLVVDMWLEGSLTSADEQRHVQHVAECVRCRERVARLERERARFLSDEMLARPPRARPIPASRSKWRAPLAGLAAAAAVAFVVWTGDVPWQRAEQDAQQPVRAKGGPRLGFFVQHEGKVRRGADGERVVAGDQLRFEITTRAPSFFAVISRDGEGRASVYYPAGEHAQAVEAAERTALDRAVSLDDVVGDERLWGLFCEEPIFLPPLLEKAAQDPAVIAPEGCIVRTLTLHKVPSP